jgi:hypothetical protein
MAFMVAHLNPPRASSCIVDIVLDAMPLLEEPRRCRAQDNDEVEVQGGRVYLHLGVRRTTPFQDPIVAGGPNRRPLRVGQGKRRMPKARPLALTRWLTGRRQAPW